jgi:hypothetical protein
MPSQHPPHLTALLALLGTALGVTNANATGPDQRHLEPVASSVDSRQHKLERSAAPISEEAVVPKIESQQYKLESHQNKLESRQNKIESNQHKLDSEVNRQPLPVSGLREPDERTRN